VHVVCDALGNPLSVCLTPGQRHEITQAEALLEEALLEEALFEEALFEEAQQLCALSEEACRELKAVLADKGYDSAAFLACIERLEAEAVIPSRKNRKQPREIDEELYKDRNKVERFFNRIKHYRRVATRYDKTAVSYLSFVHVACIMTWLL
jgi:putative transposase